MKITFTIILFLLINCTFAQSGRQVLDNVKSITEGQINKPHAHDFSHYMNHCSNEAEVLFTALFLGYKNFFSSQDSRSCTFEPSCSVYSLETIKRNGVIEGMLDTIDRLTRCNGLSPEHYAIDYEKHLLIDNPK
jgi:uncharacterized protein